MRGDIVSTVAERNRLRDETQKAFLAIKQEQDAALRAKLARLRAQRLGHVLEDAEPDRLNT
jgi:hypothetical protein